MLDNATPGGKHISAAKADRKKTIFNPARADVRTQSKACGYCHVRVSMEERAELSGGTFSIASQTGQGTLVKVCWPAAPKNMNSLQILKSYLGKPIERKPAG